MSNMKPDEKQKQDHWKKTANNPMKDQKREQRGQRPNSPASQPGQQGTQGQQGQRPQQPKPQPGQHHSDDEMNPNKRSVT